MSFPVVVVFLLPPPPSKKMWWLFLLFMVALVVVPRYTQGDSAGKRERKREKGIDKDRVHCEFLIAC